MVTLGPVTGGPPPQPLHLHFSQKPAEVLRVVPIRGSWLVQTWSLDTGISLAGRQGKPQVQSLPTNTLNLPVQVKGDRLTDDSVRAHMEPNLDFAGLKTVSQGKGVMSYSP